MKTSVKDARAALTAQIRRKQAATGLDVVAAHTNAVVLYQAIAHALCYYAQRAGVTQGELSDRLRGNKTQSTSSLTVGATAQRRMETSMGLVRSTEQERIAINRTLDQVYGCLRGLRTEEILTLLVPWLVKFAPRVGVPTEIMVTRIETLDALTRFAGTPKMHIPEDQYGLPR